MVAEGYKETEIGVIPEDWEVKQLDEIVIFKNGKGHEQVIDENGQYIVINSKFISTDGRVYKSSNSNLSPLKKDDITMVMSDIPNGKALAKYFYVDKDNKYTLNQRICSLTAIKDNPLFLFYRLIRNRYFLKFNDGVNQTNLRKNEVLECKIPLPPLKEQEKIAEILSTADEKIDAIASQIQKAQILKKGLLQKLLSEGIGHSEFKDSELGKIPESWEIVKLEDISDFITKGATPTTYGFSWEETGIPFLRSECVSDNGLVMKAAMFISDEAHKHMNRSEIKNGDLLMTITGNVGRVILLQDDISIGNINQHIARIRINSNQVDTKFVYQYVSQDNYRLNYYKITTGQAYPQISLKQVRNSIVPLPPLKEQKQIADILSTADEKLEVLRAKKQKYETLKKGLLQKLLSGEVRV